MCKIGVYIVAMYAWANSLNTNNDVSLVYLGKLGRREGEGDTMKLFASASKKMGLSVGMATWFIGFILLCVWAPSVLSLMMGLPQTAIDVNCTRTVDVSSVCVVQMKQATCDRDTGHVRAGMRVY